MTTNNFRIETAGNKAYVYTPYNPDFVSSVKRHIGGARWDATKKAWGIPAESVDAVRQIMMDVYGETDEAAAERVDVRVTFLEDWDVKCGPVRLFGRVIASAFGRDSGARVGDGVVFEQGSPCSGGSRANWYTTVPEGCVCVIHNVPKTVVDIDDDSIKVEILGEKIDREALEAEKAKLLARIAEIDALLAK